VLRPRLYANADHRLAQRAQSFEAGVTEFEAKLVFTSRVEGVMAFVAGGVRWALALFLDVNFWMDLKRVHNFSPVSIGASEMQDWGICLGCRERT
jgi:hypothetical protein